MRERIREALNYLAVDDREVWIMAGMAIKAELGQDGFDLWDEWSQGGATYKASSALSSWRSFRGSGVSVGSLFHEARAGGWRPLADGEYRVETEEQTQARKRARDERLSRESAERTAEQDAAARKAGRILARAKPEQHAYLHAKGWPDATGSVWWPNEQSNLLCIPMRVGDALVGLQMIDREGEKKYLKGQRTSDAEYVFTSAGPNAVDWWVEGYATGLSLRDCLHSLRMRYRIHVCFSAGNLKRMATSGLVVADQDASGTGEKVALATGLPYFLPPSGDFNDLHQAEGTFRASQALRKWLVGIRATSTKPKEEASSYVSS